TAPVEHIDTRPHAITPGVPIGLVVIDDHRKLELFGFEFALERLDIVLALRLGRVNADHFHAFGQKFLLPLAVRRIVADAIDAAEGEEVYDDNVAAERTGGDW